MAAQELNTSIHDYIIPPEVYAAEEQSHRFRKPAATIVKDLVPGRDDDESFISDEEKAFFIGKTLIDKGFSYDSLKKLDRKGILSILYTNLFMRSSIFDVPDIEKFVTRSLRLFSVFTQNKYEGSFAENEKIDSAIKESLQKKTFQRQFAGDGATRIFNLGESRNVKKDLQKIFSQVKIVIVGAGAAGILEGRALVELGCPPEQITYIDPRGEFGGIWNQKNVAEGSKNNPFPFIFDRVAVSAAPGKGTSITEFLSAVAGNTEYEHSLQDPIKGSVTEIIPGDLNHTVRYKQGNETKEITADIVINAIGNSRPLPLRIPNGRINIQIPDSKAGPRWQQQLSLENARKLAKDNKTLVFIGLGNSTAEMLVQLAEYRKNYYLDIPYEILTHYPYESLRSPTSTLTIEGKKYQLARNLQKPFLTKLAYDLTDIQDVIIDAFEQSRITTSVTDVVLKNDELYITQGGVLTHTLKPDTYRIFTLIGYGQDPNVLRNMGMTIRDEYKGIPNVDYDGEIQKHPYTMGEERIYKGYFGLGTVIKSDSDPNATVIPGIMHRLYDQVFSIVMRCAEAADKKKADKKQQIADSKLLYQYEVPFSHRIRKPSRRSSQ